MYNSKIANQTFLFSKSSENPERFFQGYCFVDSDYIFGEEGEKEFFNERREVISGGHDGCYVTVKKVGDDFHFSSDFSGNKKIFYYWTPHFWVVSNSIYLIAEHLKNSGIRLIVDYQQLATIGIRKGALFNQLYSQNTIISGVKILPVGQTLKISDHSYSYVVDSERKLVSNYTDGLNLFVKIWVSRLAGLLRNDVDLLSDLTGGADSRTVFSLLKLAAEVSGKNTSKPILRCGSNYPDDRDLLIAKKISNIYQFPLNEKPLSTLNSFNGEESYQSWKTLCLGVYHPIYFPNSGPQSNRVGLGGAGAENHRRFYKPESFEAFKSINAAKFSPSWLSRNFKSELDCEFHRMNAKDPKIDPLIMHYREYRNRIHGGRTPQYTTSFNPLGTRILEETSGLGGKLCLDQGQINYDIMASLLPSVLDIPFDDSKKDLTDIRRDNLTTLAQVEGVTPGKTYGVRTTEKSVVLRTKPAIEFLQEDFNQSIEAPFVKEFFTKNFLNDAESIMTQSVENKRFNHAIDGQPIAAVIAASIFD